MHSEQITAHFSSGEELTAALSELRRSGAVYHTGSLPYRGDMRSPTIHFTVRQTDGCMARAIIRRAGGTVSL